MVRSNAYGISATDLNFIRTELYKVMEMLDRVQDRQAMNSSIQNFIHTTFESSQTTGSISIISPIKSKVCNDPDPVVLATPEIHMENCKVIIEDEKKLSANLELLEHVLKGLDYKTCFEFPLQYGHNIHDYTSEVTLKPIDLESPFCMFNGYVKTGCRKKKSVVAYNLFDKMLANELNLYKLPWPLPLFEYICCSKVACEIHDNFLLCRNIVYQCCIFVFDPGGDTFDVEKCASMHFSTFRHNFAYMQTNTQYKLQEIHHLCQEFACTTTVCSIIGPLFHSFDGGNMVDVNKTASTILSELAEFTKKTAIFNRYIKIN